MQSSAKINKDLNTKYLVVFLSAIMNNPIKQLDEKSLADHRMHVIGNDPIITGHNKYKSAKGKIALIGVGGMRNLQLACELGNKRAIPEVFIIDNSRQVITFWFNIKDLFSRCLTEEDFNKGLLIFLAQNEILYRNLSDCKAFDKTVLAQYPKQNIPDFFKNLFSQYGYLYVRQIVLGAILIKQNWEEPQTFIQIKKILDHLHIPKESRFVYASNVASYMWLAKQNRTAANKILDNIAILNPKLAIHSNFHPDKLPTSIYLIDDKSQDNGWKTVFTENSKHDNALNTEYAEIFMHAEEPTPKDFSKITLSLTG